MRRGGFTLIELMIVVACISIGVTVGWTALSTIRRSGSADSELMRATTALESQMDRLRATYRSRTVDRAHGRLFTDPELKGLEEAAGSWRLTPVAAGLTHAWVWVAWRGGHGESRDAGLASLITTRREP